jgi:hypothetical protein
MRNNKQTGMLWKKFQGCCNQADAIEIKLQKDLNRQNGHQRISENKRNSLQFQLRHLREKVIPPIANRIDDFFLISAE